MDEIVFGHSEVRALKPYKGNARSHPDRQIKQIAASISANGFVSPILINPQGVIIAGHGRLLAAKKLGIDRVPTITVSGLSEAQERALRLADNKIAQNAVWDVDLVRVELAAIDASGLNLELTGFSVGELDTIAAATIDPDDDHVPAVPADPVSQAGDIWVCGESRVGCGDLLDSVSLVALMRSEKADAAITDPPFNQKIVGHVGGKGRIKHNEFAYASGEMSADEFTGFLRAGLGAAAAVSKEGAVHFVFMDHHHVEELGAAARAVYGARLNICVWSKSNPGMGSLYRSAHELVFVYRVGSKPHRNNVELGRHGRNRTNIWEYRSVNTFGGSRQQDLALHPTVKPTMMIADAIRDVTKHVEIVLDCFLGSGTTLLAAELTGRRCFGLEIEPGYVDVAVTRWMNMTGAEATLEETGETFSKVARRRRRERPAPQAQAEGAGNEA